MANIPGKYELAENKNFYELLIKLGSPEENAKAVNEAKSTFEVQVDGNKIRIKNDSKTNTTVSDLVVNEEVDEKFPMGTIAKSTTTLNGNVVTVNSKTDDSTVKRVYTFSAAGAEEILTINKGDVSATATRIFKRV